MQKSGRFDHLSNTVMKWMNHPYIQANKELLETLNPRGLRALKNIEVLDYMQAHLYKSPCCTGLFSTRKDNSVKDARVTISLDDVDIRSLTLGTLNSLID